MFHFEDIIEYFFKNRNIQENQKAKKLIEYLKIADESMQLRARDVDLNEEPLIKGVRVVEVQGSDLDLILQESEL